VDKLAAATDRLDISQHDWGTQYDAWWCPVNKELTGRAAVFSKFREFCISHGGIVVDHPQRPSGFFCASQANQDIVLFTFNTGQNEKSVHQYPNLDCATEVLIEEPAEGDSRSAAYSRLLRQEGFRTNEERVAEERAALAAREAASKQAAAEAAAQQRRKALEQQRIAHLRIQPKTPIGSRICYSYEGSSSRYSGYLVLGQPAMTKEAGTIELVGFLEGRSESRIRIRVSGINFRTPNGELSGLLNTQYQGSTIRPDATIWDDLSTWHLCD